MDADPSQAEAPKANDGSWLSSFVMALRFFSRLPSGGSPHRRPELGRIAVVLPLASIVIAIGPVMLLVAGTMAGMPSYFAATLAVAAMVLVTGAMAEDALADAADGLFGGYTAERRLAIMKDSRHGTYGVAALCLFVLLRITALGAVAAEDAVAAGGIWFGASLAGRSLGLWPAVVLPAARADGVSAAAGRLGLGCFAPGAAVASGLLVVLGSLLAGPVAAVTALALACGVAAGWTALCRRLVGGQTGDLIGALGALIEIAALTGLLLG